MDVLVYILFIFHSYPHIPHTYARSTSKTEQTRKGLKFDLLDMSLCSTHMEYTHCHATYPRPHDLISSCPKSYLIIFDERILFPRRMHSHFTHISLVVGYSCAAEVPRGRSASEDRRTRPGRRRKSGPDFRNFYVRVNAPQPLWLPLCWT